MLMHEKWLVEYFGHLVHPQFDVGLLVNSDQFIKLINSSQLRIHTIMVKPSSRTVKLSRLGFV